jgi:hypothetical protein
MHTSKLKIIVSGMVAGYHLQGGAAWAVLQYVLGLLRLGHDVYLIEPITTNQLVPPSSPLESSRNAAEFLEITRDFGLNGRSTLILQGTMQTAGISYPELRTIAESATLLLNISGMLQQEDLIKDIPYRVYLDLDPAFNQLWHATQGIDMHLGAHNYFVTVGNALGQPTCRVPTCGVHWITTFQPVVLEDWPVATRIAHDAFTTVANWRGYGSIQHDGIFYGQKAHSLRPLVDLPTRTSEKFMLALAIHPDERNDLDALARNGWILLDPARLAGTPREYQEFISRSKAEFGIAKSGYVASRCGWFSDRSACYLACGRPVLAQDTGFAAFLPCGEGLFSFTTTDDALAGIESINGDYARHARAARSIAVEYFDSRTVLSKLFRAIGLSA